MKAAGATSKAPLKEAFGEWRNLKVVLIALFGAVAGQAVIGFAAHLYPLFYLEKIARVAGATANFPVATALTLIIPSRSEEPRVGKECVSACRSRLRPEKSK